MPSVCVLCSTGCGIEIGVREGRMVGVRGRAGDRVSRGRLGPKGLHGWEANDSSDRLTRPLVRRDGTLRPTSWAEALGLIVERTPEAFVFDAEGKLVYHGTIDDNAEDASEVKQRFLGDALEAVATGKPVETKQTKALGCTIKYYDTPA